jgi:serine/threonine protein phosphatase PrpC
MEPEAPVLGRPSPAAGAEPVLRAVGLASQCSYRADGGTTGWCTLRAVSVTGVRHRLAGLPGDDSFAWAWTDSLVAVAVADGIGSLTGSGPAASRAVEAAVQAAVSAGDHGVGHAVAEGLAAGNVAASGGGATTLVLAVVDRSWQAGVGRVGDSSAFVVGPGEPAWEEVFPPPGADGTVGTATPALPSESPLSETAAVDLDPSMVLVLATDGIADPWRDGPATVAPALAAGLARPTSPLDLARLADFSRQGCHDDRTLAALWVQPDGAPKGG